MSPTRGKVGGTSRQGVELLPSMAGLPLPDLNCCFIRFTNFSLYVVIPANFFLSNLSMCPYHANVKRIDRSTIRVFRTFVLILQDYAGFHRSSLKIFDTSNTSEIINQKNFI